MIRPRSEGARGRGATRVPEEELMKRRGPRGPYPGDGRSPMAGDGPLPDPQDPTEPGDDEDRPFISEELDVEETQLERSLRPPRFEDFIGQRRVVENLRIAIEAAKGRREVLEHVLLSGMPGLGKTTLAFIVAETLGVDI